jgi:adenylate kinase family enzyme
MEKFGKKIVVVGVSASGKSTFTRKLSEKTKLPVTFMDALMWKPGWEYIGDEETVRKLDEESSTPEWIIEGYISKKARTLVFDRADKIIYLDYSAFVSTWRYIMRWLKHRKKPRPELEGSPEKFSFKFLRLVWSKGEAITLNKYLQEVTDQKKIITFTSPKQAKNFLQNL